MINKSECYIGECDNCGEIFQDGDFSLFPLSVDVSEMMTNSGWYADGADPDHKGKHYCPDCFEPHPDQNDKIIVETE